MIQGLLAAASGMEAQQQQLDALANDIANVNTPGYQSEQLGFHDLLYSTAGAASGTPVATGAGTAAVSLGRSQVQGALQQTGRPLDVAISGEGYLQVRRPDGTVGLTRNGALQLGENRQLTDQQGDPLVAPVTIPNGVSLDNVKIASDGTVVAAGRTVGRISLVTVPAPNGLLAAGNSLFTPTAASGAVRPAAGATLQQGALEASNVDLATAMSQMLDAQRSYSLNSEEIQTQNQMMQIANQIIK